MPQTRQDTKTGLVASHETKQPTAAEGKENQPPAGSPPQQRNSNNKRGFDAFGGDSSVLPPRKQRHSGGRVDTSEATPLPEEQDNREASRPTTSPRKSLSTGRDELISRANVTPSRIDIPKVRFSDEGFDIYNETTLSDKPALTVEDLQFDYNRSQLRDPRATPGRKARPYYEKYDDVPVALLSHLKETRSIYKSARPRGRLTSVVKNDMFVAEARRNPCESFYALHQCYDKGRHGSPTYDAAGFQLDYDKVCNWMKPQAYNKNKVVRGMERTIDAMQKEREAIFALFFVAGYGPDERERGSVLLEDIVKDQISKDSGVPIHQIDVMQAQRWRQVGHMPVKFREWWKEPNAEEKTRLSKMMSGASMRKEI